MFRFMGKGLAGEEAKEAAPPPKGPVFSAGVFTVDLVPENLGGPRLLRVGVALQATSSRVVRQLQNRDAEVKHLIVAILRGRTASSLVGSAGMASLGKEIGDAINAAVARGGVTEVYFPELVMQ